MTSSRLKPTNPIAGSAILAGDPGRALMLAQELLVDPLMSNHARGLWGYTAATSAGQPLTIQATGMGAPSAAIVLSDLARLGLRRAIRIGTCEALSSGYPPGTLVCAAQVLATDGVSRSLGAGAGTEASSASAEAAPRVLNPDPELGRRLGEDAPAVTVLSSDMGTVVRESTGGPSLGRSGADAAVADLQTGALLAVGAALGVSVAALLIVERSPAAATAGPAKDAPGEAWTEVDAGLLEERIKLAGRLAAGALH